LTIRVTDELLVWLKEMSRRTDYRWDGLFAIQLERAKAEKGNRRFLSLADEINGPSDLSSREGFSGR
jgi:hypothetical protein